MTYRNIKNFYLDQNRALKQPMLNAESIWIIETDLEPELNIRFNEGLPEEDLASNNSTLQKKATKRKHILPIKKTPDKLMVTFGDKTTTITNTRKQVARKTFIRRTNEPRDALKPLWNIIPDGTITNYSPTTIRLDIYNRKNTVIRKNDLAIVNETKPRLMRFVACKTVREYNRNQGKIKQFLLTEKKNVRQAQIREQQEECVPGPPFQVDQPGPNSTQQTQPTKNSRQQRKPQQPKRKGTAPTKRLTKENKVFELRSKEAALAQSKLEKARQRQKEKLRSPRIQLDTSKLHNNKSGEIINLASCLESPLTIFTSDNRNLFMYTPTNEQSNSPSKIDKKIDKIIRRITSSPKKHPLQPETEQLITIMPAASSTPIGNNTKTLQQDDNEQTSKPTGNNANAPLHINIEQTSTSTDNNAYAPQQTDKDQADPPDERQDTNTEKDNIQTEDQDGDYSGTSFISSINTAEIEALNKIFDQSKIKGGGKLWWTDPQGVRNQVSHLLI